MRKILIYFFQKLEINQIYQELIGQKLKMIKNGKLKKLI